MLLGYQQRSVDKLFAGTALLVIEKSYAANAKVIQTVDEMLQETTNIKR